MNGMFRRPTSRVAGLILVALIAAACGQAGSAVLSTVGSAVDPRPAPEAPDGLLGGDTSGGPEAAAVQDGARIVFTGSLDLQVSDLAAAVASGRDVANGLGGYVGGSRMSNNGEQSTASIAYRIPSDRWEEGLAAFRALGTVIGEQTDSADVTGQLVDLEARIRNLRASETALQRIAADATAVEDVLDVEKRLTEIRGQIEQLDAQRANLDDQASFGTLTVTYGREIVAVVEAARGWNPAAEVDRASATLVDVVQAITTAGIWFAIVWLPLLVVLAILLLVGRFILRRAGILATEPRRAPSES